MHTNPVCINKSGLNIRANVSAVYLHPQAVLAGVLDCLLHNLPPACAIAFDEPVISPSNRY